jgi:hypothetical protein
MSTFEIGKAYSMRSPCDHGAVWTYKVVGRTQKTVKLFSGGKMISRRIKVWSGVETCMPLGTYSMAPCLQADRRA